MSERGRTNRAPLPASDPVPEYSSCPNRHPTSSLCLRWPVALPRPRPLWRTPPANANPHLTVAAARAVTTRARQRERIPARRRRPIPAPQRRLIPAPPRPILALPIPALRRRIPAPRIPARQKPTLALPRPTPVLPRPTHAPPRPIRALPRPIPARRILAPRRHRASPAELLRDSGRPVPAPSPGRPHFCDAGSRHASGTQYVRP